MRLYNVYGKLQSKQVTRFLVDWDKPCRSKVQFKTKQFLKQFWENQVVYEEFPVYGTKMKVDILNATKKIAVEVQGNQHVSFNKFFHNNSRLKYLESIKRDAQKAQWLEKNGYTLVEIHEKEVESLNKEFFLNNFNIAL
tara:strand:+ start:70 stop:486 length:417 start_codon:yes stop_codon:yes gene_type:complete